MATLLSVCLGIGLAAAAGFRVFVPLLGLGLAARFGYIDLVPSFAWMAGTPALVAFAVATVVEIGAYYVPWLDHLLDVAASPIAVAAGVLATASVVTGIEPWERWTLAVIAGGGTAGAVQALTVGTRKVSLLTTAGLANPVVSTVEMASSVVMTVLAVAVPLVAVAAFAGIVVLSLRLVRRARGHPTSLR